MTISAMFGLFKKRDTHPADTIAPLLDFIPRFEAGQFKRAIDYYNKHDNNVLPEVQALRKALLQSGLIYGHEWARLPSTVLLKIWKNPDDLSALDAHTLQTTLTAFVRADHLSEGIVLSAMCQQGFIHVALDRVKTLHNNNEITPILRFQ
ncbi:MAG TPA: DUF6508 domain-containing protein [Pseudomonadales bacterium]